MLRTVVAVSILASTAYADDLADQAGALAEAGQAEHDAGKLRQAIDLYRQAYAKDPDPVILCDIALADQLLGDLPRAQALFTQCLPRLPATSPEAVANFRAVADQVDAALPAAHVAVDVVTDPPGAALDVDVLSGDEPPVGPAVVWLPEGAHTIHATLAGFQSASESIAISADDIAKHPRRTVHLQLTRIVPVTHTSSRKGIGVGIFVGGAITLVAGGVMHYVTYREREDLAGLSGAAYTAELPTFRNERTLTLSLYGAGLIAAAVGGYLFESSPRITLAVAPESGGGAAVWLDYRP